MLLKVIRLGVVLFASGLMLSAPGALAHTSGGQIELVVRDVEFESHPDGVLLRASLADRDSGEPASGFALQVTAAGGDGGAKPPIALTERSSAGQVAGGGDAVYEGVVPLGQGEWRVTLTPGQGQSPFPALVTPRSISLAVDEEGGVARPSGDGGGSAGLLLAVAAAIALAAGAGVALVVRRRGAHAATAAVLVAGCLVLAARPVGAQETTTTTAFNPASEFGTEPVNVAVEVRTDYPDTLPSSLYIPLRARLTDPATGQPVEAAYSVVARITGPGKPPKEAYGFAYPYGDTPGAEPGAYHGMVIVPSGGTWSMVVTAHNIEESEASPVPRTLGRVEIEVDAEGGPLESFLAGEGPEGGAELAEVALLFLHSVLGAAWFGLAAIIILIALPSRRRVFGHSRFNEFLDHNVGRIGAALLWTTGILWLSGVLNLQKTVAYPPPLSGDQADTLWVLPYAKPYIAALYSKIGIYALATLAVFPLIREAKRQVVHFDAARLREERAAARPPGSGSEGPLPEGGATAGAVVATAARPTTSPARRRAGSATASNGRLRPLSRLSVATVAVAAPVILVCVTVLKYVHILSEQLRPR